MSLNNNQIIENNGADKEIYCSNCNTRMNQLTRENIYFKYYKCPNCQKIFKVQKKLTVKQILFNIGEQLQKLKFAVYCITFIVVLEFIISIILLLKPF